MPSPFFSTKSLSTLSRNNQKQATYYNKLSKRRAKNKRARVARRINRQ